jgi:hypothetical protein
MIGQVTFQPSGHGHQPAQRTIYKNKGISLEDTKGIPNFGFRKTLFWELGAKPLCLWAILRQA